MKVNQKKNNLKRFKSSILNPDKIFKTSDDKCYIDIEKCPEIVDSPQLQRVILKTKSDAISSMISYIKEIYPNWYDDEDDLKLPEVCKLVSELFDVVSIYNKGNNIEAEYWINAYSSHKNSNNFFGNHSISVSYVIDKSNFKYKEYNKPSLEG